MVSSAPPPIFLCMRLYTTGKMIPCSSYEDLFVILTVRLCIEFLNGYDEANMLCTRKSSNQHFLKRLFEAAQDGRAPELDVIMDHKPEILKQFLKGKFYMTPLHVSVKYVRYEFTVEILRMLPDMALKYNKHMLLPSDFAALKGNYQILHLIRAKPELLRIPHKDEQPVVHLAMMGMGASADLSYLNRLFNEFPKAVFLTNCDHRSFLLHVLSDCPIENDVPMLVLSFLAHRYAPGPLKSVEEMERLKKKKKRLLDTRDSSGNMSGATYLLGSDPFAKNLEDKRPHDLSEPGSLVRRNFRRLLNEYILKLCRDISVGRSFVNNEFWEL
ncbi:hypothetical protein TorRG33x02_336160 [Trema orientale]|uniref:Ankyrin repeat-containing domain containing protein n=1 Tax=Trema orientale TaxID=63057 RepID=A0A2P5B0D8_TREOI|nr:hypothetical protein TorRG33x02_336160 [Trema orientale]